MSALMVVFCLVSLVALIDVVRRPGSDWVAADKSRGMWILYVLVFNVIGSVAYALVVLPRFRGARVAVDDEFRRVDS